MRTLKPLPHTSFVHNGVARFVTYCLGTDPRQTQRLRDAYRHNLSEFSSSMVKATSLPYSMSVVHMHSSNAEQAFEMLSTVIDTASAPHVLVLGEGFRAPYSHTFSAWVKQAQPSIIRVQEQRIPVTDLERDEYYLGTCSVLANTEIDDAEIASAAIDYGVLVHLNSRRYVVLDDDSAVLLTPEEQAELTAMLTQTPDTAAQFIPNIPEFISARPVQAASRGGALWG